MATQHSARNLENTDGGLRRGMLGFMLPHEQFPIRALVAQGIAAEQAGFDLIAASDHFQPWQANEGHSTLAWLTLGSVGQQTQRIWLGPTVTCPTLRYHPAVVAEAFASLSQLCPGRIYLGLGSGEALNERAATGAWPDWEERSERLIEAAAIIRELWSGRDVHYDGKYYHVNGRLYDPPAAPIPILFAANGKKAMRRAGRFGDGLVTDPKTWKTHKAEFEQGARDAGKDPRAMPVLIEQYAVVGDEQAAREAAELWRFSPKGFLGYHNVTDPHEIQRLAEEEVPLEQVYADWSVGPRPDAHVESVAALFESGASIVNIHTGQPDQLKVLEFYGKKVLPELRAMRAGGSA